MRSAFVCLPNHLWEKFTGATVIARMMRGDWSLDGAKVYRRIRHIVDRANALAVQHADGQGIHNNKWDAFKHAYASCELTRDIGGVNAKRLGDAHEDDEQQGNGDPKQREKEKNMDLRNNAVGRTLAGRDGNCATLSMQALHAGELQTSLEP
jgi:hypothetical protein